MVFISSIILAMLKRHPSELLFERYLNSLGLNEDEHFDHEPDLGPPEHPDYQLRVLSPAVLFEVKSYSRESQQSKTLWKQAEENGRRIESGEELAEAMRLDPYGETRNKVEKARQKFRNFRNTNPCVLVLEKGDGLLVDHEPNMLAAALFGDMQLVTNTATGKSHWQFGPNGVLRGDTNTTISAVCALQLIRPEADKLKSIVSTKKGTDHMGFGDYKKLYDKVQIETGLNPNKEIVRVRTIINPFARISFDHSIFSGPFDEIYLSDSTTGSWGRVK